MPFSAWKRVWVCSIEVLIKPSVCSETSKDCSRKPHVALLPYIMHAIKQRHIWENKHCKFKTIQQTVTTINEKHTKMQKLIGPNLWAQISSKTGLKHRSYVENMF